MGYGTKLHRDGIEKYGITQWHRKTYGLCKTAGNAIIPELETSLGVRVLSECNSVIAKEASP
jgi:hypothetical protein